jgi:hypothetical protein
LTVDEDHGAIVGRAEPDEDPMSQRRRAIEFALIPDRAFVEHEVRALRIPVARDLKALGGIEIVFDQLALGFWLLVGAETTVGLRLIAVVVIAGFVRIDDDAPRPVEADAVT